MSKFDDYFEDLMYSRYGGIFVMGFCVSCLMFNVGTLLFVNYIISLWVIGVFAVPVVVFAVLMAINNKYLDK